MNSNLCLQSFALSLLFISLSAYSDYYYTPGYVGSNYVGYGNQGIYVGDSYVGFGNQGYVNYGGYGTNGYDEFGPYGYSNPDYRRLGTGTNGDYYVNGAQGQGSSMIYEQPYTPSSTVINNYSCTIEPGHFDATGNWVNANRVCVGQ